MTPNRPTIRDVARLAGVSHQTVSRVINGIPLVSEETRQRVQDAISQLGFRPNAIARSMASGQTHTLACLAPNLTDFTFASIIEGAVTEARRHGYFLLSAPCDDEHAFAILVDQLVNSRRTDGLMVINPYIDGRFRYLSPEFPVVYVGAVPRGEPYNSIALDNNRGAHKAVEYLQFLGYHQVAMITGPLLDDSAVERLAGYRECLQENNCPYDDSLVYQGDWTATSGYLAFEYFHNTGHIPKAVFASNDRMAIGFIRAASEAGLNIPGDLIIIGFDDMPLASYFNPPLTTMRQDINEMGRKSAQLLISKIENPDKPLQNLRLQAELVIRSSTRAFTKSSQPEVT